MEMFGISKKLLNAHEPVIVLVAYKIHKGM